MKNRLFLALASVTIFAVAACGETATPESGTKDESDLTLQQVFDKAIERQQSLKNVHAVVEMQQMSEMLMEEQVIQMTYASNFDMDISQAPVAMYINGTVEMNVGEGNMDVPLEMYMTEQEGLYMLNSDTNEWIKLPQEQQDQMLKQTASQADASQQLEQLKQFVNDFTFEQDDENYKLTLKIEGEGLKKFILSQLNSGIVETTQLDEEVISNMSFEESKYEFIITKDTFDMKKIDIDLTMFIDMEGQKSKFVNDVIMSYSKFDKVGMITIPKEVINKAITQ